MTTNPSNGVAKHVRVGSFEASVLVNGKPLNVYDHEGASFVEGRRGSTFELKFRNITGKRVLVVPAVDGLSVMDGKQVNPQSRGYIVNAYATITIPGWRLDNDKVAQFFFQDRKRSYAESSGEAAGNTGVIGFLVYEEQEVEKVVIDHHHHHYPTHPRPMIGRAPWHQPLWVRDAQANPWSDEVVTYSSKSTFGDDVTKTADDFDLGPQASYASAATPKARAILGLRATKSVTKSAERRVNLDAEPEDFGLGAGFGKAADHKVTTVEFKRKSDSPLAQIAMFYDTRKNLERRGIQVVPDKFFPEKTMPNPFPGMPQQTGCKPPSNWRG